MKNIAEVNLIILVKVNQVSACVIKFYLLQFLHIKTETTGYRLEPVYTDSGGKTITNSTSTYSLVSGLSNTSHD